MNDKKSIDHRNMVNPHCGWQIYIWITFNWIRERILNISTKDVHMSSYIIINWTNERTVATGVCFLPTVGAQVLGKKIFSWTVVWTMATSQCFFTKIFHPTFDIRIMCWVESETCFSNIHTNLFWLDLGIIAYIFCNKVVTNRKRFF